MQPIDIVMVTYNRLEFTLKAISHIKERTKTPYRLIVVDNNSTDGSVKYLVKLKQEGVIGHLILLEENYGIHMAKNYGLALVRSHPYYIDTDNDLLCQDTDPDWIAQLTALMDKNPDYGAISCRPQVLVGRSNKEFDEAGEVVEFSHVGGHLRIMRTDAVRQVEGWEKTWEANRNHEDHYIASQLHSIGLKVGYARDVRCWHMFGENWGYKNIPAEKHGHRPVWPPPEHFDSEITKYNTQTWEISKE